jgi:uncharacterized membrane protein YbhN (UPF0104 family)
MTAGAADVAPSKSTSAAMPETRRSLGPRLLRLALVGVTLVALSRLIHRGDAGRAVELVSNVGWPLALVLLPTAVAMTLDARGWQAILRTLRQSVRFEALFELRLSVEAVVLSLPGGALAGEALKVALLNRRADVPMTTGGASLALTKACLIGAESLYITIAAAWVGLTILLGSGPTAVWPLWVAVTGAAITALTSGTLFAVLHGASWASLIGRLLHALPSARLRRWAEGRAAKFEELDRSAAGFFGAPLRARAICVLPFLLEWLTEGAETLLILRCLGVPLGVGSVLLMDATGSLLRALAFFVPGGLGVQDAAQIVLLRALGVPDAAAAGAALIFIKRTKEVFWVVTGLSFLAVRKDLWRQAKASQTA